MRLLALLALPLTLTAQGFGLGSRPAQPPAGVVPMVVDSASPRASVVGFLNAARAGDFERAATWLNTADPALAARAPELARRLKSVLDARLWVDEELISPVAAGDTTDGLPADREQLGTIDAADGVAHPIRLARVTRDGTVRWVFSQSTVESVDGLYAALPDNWIREHLPAPLLVAGPFDVLWWQWIALLLLLPIAALIGVLLAPPTQALLRRAVSRTDTAFDDELVASARGPLVLLWGVAASRVLLRWVALAAPAEAFVHGLQRAGFVVAAFWIILRAIGVLQDALPVGAWAARHPALRSLIPLGGRIARLLVFVLGVLTVIATFGYPVATILAGLGIGGIAVALGAQKSLEHFFGSVSIGVDQPFRVGDWIAVDGIEGEVESIGLRSTRIRTMDRTIVSIPNGRLAESRSENFGARERVRFRTVVGLEYGTSAETIKRVRDGIEALLRAHPKTWPDRVVVRLFQFSPSSLDLEVFCWIDTPAIDEFRAIREELMLGIMGVVERNGARFAFPTQTVHVRSEERGPR
jgi:MscS family membrane protein